MFDLRFLGSKQITGSSSRNYVTVTMKRNQFSRPGQEFKHTAEGASQLWFPK